MTAYVVGSEDAALADLDLTPLPADRFAYQNRFVPFIIRDANGNPVVSVVSTAMRDMRQEMEKAAAKAAPAKAASSRRRSTAKATEDAVDAPADAGAAPGTDAVTPVQDEPHPRKSEEERRDEALDLIVGTVDALISERGAEEKIWGSMIKQALKRRKPGFNESYYGFRSFNAMLEAAAAAGSLALERDEKSGGYLVRLAAGED